MNLITDSTSAFSTNALDRDLKVIFYHWNVDLLEILNLSFEMEFSCVLKLAAAQHMTDSEILAMSVMQEKKMRLNFHALTFQTT